MAASSITLSVKSEPGKLKTIRTLIEQAACDLNLDKDQTGCIVLAVDEVCSNIIRHGYQLDTSKQLDITLSLSENKFEIQVCDTGTPFDLTCAKARDPKDIKPGGLGVYIVREIMDDIKYETDCSGTNRTTLTKYL